MGAAHHSLREHPIMFGFAEEVRALINILLHKIKEPAKADSFICERVTKRSRIEVKVSKSSAL